MRVCSFHLSLNDADVLADALLLGTHVPRTVESQGLAMATNIPGELTL